MVVTVRAIFARNIRVTKISFHPYYLSMMQMLAAVLYVVVLLALPSQSDISYPSNFFKSWSLIAVKFACFCMECSLLIYTLTQELIYALIKFQRRAGPTECLVRRDEHFAQERKIVRRFKVLLWVIIVVKVLSIVDAMVEGLEYSIYCKVLLYVNIFLILGL